VKVDELRELLEKWRKKLSERDRFGDYNLTDDMYVGNSTAKSGADCVIDELLPSWILRTAGRA
jgi:hypothetical protein